MASGTNPQVVPIFATPFCVVRLAQAQNLNPVLAGLFAERATPKWGAKSDVPATHTFRSRDDLTEWPEEPVRETLNAILASVSSVAASISDYSADDFAALQRQARAWFTIVRTDGCVPPTSYPNTSWVGLYCVAAPEPSNSRVDSGVLRLHEWRPGTSFQDACHGGLRLPYRPSHCTWRPVAGEMAVFPAHITHEIAMLRAAGALTIVTARVRFVASDRAWMPPW